VDRADSPGPRYQIDREVVVAMLDHVGLLLPRGNYVDSARAQAYLDRSYPARRVDKPRDDAFRVSIAQR